MNKEIKNFFEKYTEAKVEVCECETGIALMSVSSYEDFVDLIDFYVEMNNNEKRPVFRYRFNIYSAGQKVVDYDVSHISGTALELHYLIQNGSL